MAYKKFISLLLVLCMSFSFCSAAFADANFDDDGNRTQDDGLVNVDDESDDVAVDREKQELEEPEDVYLPSGEHIIIDAHVKSNYEKLQDKLIALDVWNETNVPYATKVTRGEFASIVAKLMNISAPASKQTFLDVSNDHLYYNDIEALYDLGIIKLPSDGMFKPDEKINYAFAVTMLVRALGYEPYALTQGDYPTNYLTTAYSKNIVSRKSTFQQNESINLMDTATLIDNLLTAKVFQRESYGDIESYEEGKIVLEKFHHINKVKGTVNAIGKYYINGFKSLADNEIQIDNTIVNNIGFDFLPYLGARLDVYYKTDSNDENTVIYFEEKENYNEIVEISGDDITGYEGNTLSYDLKDGNIEKISLANGIKAIINNFEPSDFILDDLLNSDLIRLIDNNNDGIFEVLFISKYTTHIVARVNRTDSKVYDYYNKTVIDIDSNGNDTVIVDSAGNPVDHYYIQEWSVLSIGMDNTGTKKRIVVSNTNKKGTVNEIKNIDTPKDAIIKLDEVEYKFSRNASLFTGDYAPKINRYYIFYLDYMGRIAGFNQQVQSDLQYGYLIKAANDRGLAEKAELLIFPFSDNIKTFKTAEKVTIDGKTGLSGKKVIDELETITNALNDKMAQLDTSYVKPTVIYNNGAIYVRQPITYILNADQDITQIDTPYCGLNEDLDKRDSLLGRNSMTLYDDFSKRGASTDKPGGLFLRNTLTFGGDTGHTISVPTELKLFIVPVSNDFNILDDYDNYSKDKMKYFKAWKNYPETGTNFVIPNRLDAYNVAVDRSCPLMVYSTTLSIGKVLDKTTPLTVIKEIKKAINEDGEEVTVLSAFQGISEINIPFAQNVSITKQFNGPNGSIITSTLSRGDIIRFETNYKNEITGYVKVFSLRDEDDPNYVMTGNEVGASPDLSQLNKTLLAVSTDKYAANGHNTSHIYNAINDFAYTSSFRLVFGTVLYKNKGNLVINTDLDSTMGRVKSSEICEAKTYNILLIDEAADRIYVPSVDEIMPLYNSTEKDATKVILHTETGRQKMLIIVKRKQS